MLFKKKREAEDTKLYNISGDAYFDKRTGEFLLPFSQEQKTYMLHCINHSQQIKTPRGVVYSHNLRPIAEPDIPLQVMEVIIYELNETGRGYTFQCEPICEVRDVDVWKLAKIYARVPVSRLETLPLAVDALWFGLKLWEELPDFLEYNRGVLNSVVLAASCSENWCDKVYRGMDVAKFKEQAELLYQQKVIKAQKKDMTIEAYEAKYVKPVKARRKK